MATAQFDYADGQRRDSHAALLAEYAAVSEAALVGANVALDLRYGPHPRQTLDLFRAPGTARATLVYFHAGYWQSRDKADFRFLAPPLTADGFDVALVNYPLAPETPVAEIAPGIVAAMPDILALLGPAPIVLAGHSAGGQIVVEIAMAAPVRIAGIVAISGVFDLVPLIGTSINERLGLDETAAHRASPVDRALPGSPAALFAVGGDETGGFREQTRRMHAAWQSAGNPAQHIVTPGADHFSILRHLADPADPLGAAVRTLI